MMTTTTNSSISVKPRCRRLGTADRLRTRVSLGPMEHLSVGSMLLRRSDKKTSRAGRLDRYFLLPDERREGKAERPSLRLTPRWRSEAGAAEGHVAERIAEHRDVRYDRRRRRCGRCGRCGVNEGDARFNVGALHAKAGV